MPAQGPGTEDACTSCGRPGDDLEEVRRVYVTVDDGRVTGSETVAGAEWWCLACRALYPHLPGGSDQGAGSRPAGQPPPPA